MSGRPELKPRDLASADVDLWGKKFVTVPAVRSVYKRLQELERKFDELTDDQPDEQVEVMAEILDARLKPAGQGRKKAGEIIKEKWKADELSIGQLLDFAAVVADADHPPT